MVSPPSGLVSWIDVALPVLGASTMGRTMQGSPSIDVLPPEEGDVLSEIASVKLVPSESQTWAQECMFRPLL